MKYTTFGVPQTKEMMLGINQCLLSFILYWASYKRSLCYFLHFKVKKIWCFFFFSSFKEKGREREAERNINWLSLTHVRLGTEPETQASALTGIEPLTFRSYGMTLQPTGPRRPGQLWFVLKKTDIAH